MADVNTHKRIGETAYTFRYFPQQSPILINYLARRANVAAPAVDAPFTYLDLGCGNGITANTLAAASPKSRFFGVDHLPEHIANARGVAEAGELENIPFIESSFRNLAEHDLPQFDFIALHGIYSWVSEAERSDIRDVIDKHLKPGGLVYVSYNALPGSAVLDPMRDLIKQYTDAISGSPREKAAEAIKFLTNLQENDARYIKDNPVVSATIDDMRDRNINYVAHEYLTEHYQSFSIKTVAAEMAEKSLKYCCGVTQGPAWIRRSQLRKFRYLLSSRSTQLAKDNLTGILLNENFRADIYCRPDHERVDGSSPKTFMTSTFGATNLLPQLHPPSRNLNSEADMILQIISPGQADMGTCAETPEMQMHSPDRLHEFVHYMVEDQFLYPFANKVIEPVEPADDAESDVEGQTDAAKEQEAEVELSWNIISGYNRFILKNRLLRTGRCALASPVVGDGIVIDLITGVFLLALTEAPDQDPVKFSDRSLKTSGRQWLHRGVPVVDPVERKALLTKDHVDFMDNRLPLLVRLGIVESQIIPGDDSP